MLLWRCYLSVGQFVFVDVDAYDFVVDAEDVVKVVLVHVLFKVSDPKGVALSVGVDA
jgi:hypothetical protein